MERQPKTLCIWVMVGLMLLLVTVPALAQQKTPEAPAPPKTYKMTTPIPPSIPIPDKVCHSSKALPFQ